MGLARDLERRRHIDAGKGEIADLHAGIRAVVSPARWGGVLIEHLSGGPVIAGVDVAFLPMNLPYTMTPEMAADAARMIRPKILYPYHFGETDTSRLIGLLRDEKGIEVRIRRMK